MCKAMEEMRKMAFVKGYVLGYVEGYREGLAETREERSIECAKDLLAMEKMPPEKVAKLTCLPLETVLTLCEKGAVAL